MIPISNLARDLLAQRAQERDDLRRKLTANEASSPTRFERKVLPALSRAFPDVTVEQLLEHSRWELRDAEQRLRVCRRCPATGGACEGADGYYAEGKRPTWSGSRFEPTPCETWRPFAERRLLRAAGVPGVFLDATFDSYAPQDPQQQSARREAKSYAAALAERDNGALILEGDTGLGKTHLAVAALRVIAKHTESLLFAYVPSFLDELRAQATSDEPGRLFGRACEARMLVLDDLGAERPTEFAREKLEQLIHVRWSERRPMIITQNTSLEQLQSMLGAPLVRRIKDATSVYIELRGDAYNGTSTWEA